MKWKKIIFIGVIVIIVLAIYFLYTKDWVGICKVDKDSAEKICQSFNDESLDIKTLGNNLKDSLKEHYNKSDINISIEENEIGLIISPIGKDGRDNGIFVGSVYNKKSSNLSNLVSFPKSKEKNDFKKELSKKFGAIRPVFDLLSFKKEKPDYYYWFSPPCWSKNEYGTPLIGDFGGVAYGYIEVSDYVIIFEEYMDDYRKGSEMPTFVNLFSESLNKTLS
ncbi:hypothetical protein SDC9_149600 [bioreactor metagenome]|uniref:Uncharacterized protein n=1 Tax=bioreactor metagenome TaxID=1076179 RepID=A0A645EP18_9ZZZZ